MNVAADVPVHQVTEFAPDLSFGGSASHPGLVALALTVVVGVRVHRRLMDKALLSPTKSWKIKYEDLAMGCRRRPKN